MNRLSSAIRSLTKTDIAAIFFIGLGFALIFIRAFIDGTLSDESFYLTIPMRIINGDGLFTDEWHLSQLSSVLLYLPVKLFITFTGGSEGIVLYMRILFCFMQLGVGILLYKTLKQYGLTAIIISISFMPFFIIGINTVSYNTIGLASLFVIICLMYRGINKPSYLKMLLSGSLIAVFILCQPFGIVFYLMYFTAVCVFFIKSKTKKTETPFFFTLKSFFATVAGILPIFIFFLYLLFKNSDIETILRCIPGILNDIEHMQVTEDIGIKTFSLFIFFKDMTMCSGLVPLIIFVLCLAAALVMKKKNRNIAFIITAVGFAAISVIFWFRLSFMRSTTETDDINFYYFPLALTGAVFYILSGRKNKPVFILFWCTGIIYALLMTVSSNMALHASVNGYVISAAASLLFAKEAYDELMLSEETDKIKKLTAALIVITFFGLSLFNTAATLTAPTAVRLTSKSTKMMQGIYKGISFPNDQVLIYTRALRDAEEMKEILSPDDKLFVLENLPSVYLEGNFNMGVFSGWFICEQLQYKEIRDRFRDYYSIFPENVPDYIYVPSYRYGSDGVNSVLPKMHAEFAYSLFEGTHQELYDGLLIKVTGIKDE